MRGEMGQGSVRRRKGGAGCGVVWCGVGGQAGQAGQADTNADQVKLARLPLTNGAVSRLPVCPLPPLLNSPAEIY
jgi:hypothetical protein